MAAETYSTLTFTYRPGAGSIGWNLLSPSFAGAAFC